MAKSPGTVGPRATTNNVNIAGERYVYSSVELPGVHPIRLYSLRSYDQATGFLRSLNQTLLVLGLAAIALGALIVFLLSRQITRPLELLADGARHFAKDDFDFSLQTRGRDEVAEQLLAFSRKQVLDPQIVDANHSVQNMVKMLRVLIGADVELATNLADGAHRIQVDPGQFEQVIMNLAVNARDAMPDGGKLIIETNRCLLDESYVAGLSEVIPGSYVVLAVTDSGCGMTPETREHIFEPFFTTKDLGKGTGLGLATVYGIVKQSRGHISVYSEIGLGTTFKIYLPAVEKSVSVATQQSIAPAPRGNETVLVVEDEAALRSLAVESLKRLGYKVLEAGDGVKALAIADEFAGTIDVLITDMIMPKMGGLELAGRLRQKRPDIRMIFMSGYTEAATLDRARLEPDAVLLSKPFSIETLASKIRDFQKKPAAMAASAR